MLPEIANHLWEYGFKTKKSIYEYMYKRSFMPLKEFRLHSRPDIFFGSGTTGWKGVEPSSGKHWMELSEDFMVAACSDPMANCVIVMGAGEEGLSWGEGSSRDAYSIDNWR
jgi:hypothetical protein